METRSMKKNFKSFYSRQESQEQVKKLFDKYDKNKDGFIDIQELRELILSEDYDYDIPTRVVVAIHERADTDHSGELDFEEFRNMVKSPQFRYIFGRYMNRLTRLVITRKETRKEFYDDHYSCSPPAIGMIIISIVEIIFFCLDEAFINESTKCGPVGRIFIFDPSKRLEVWRYLTYMFVHIGPIHLGVNVLVQVVLGTPLEMVHEWWQVQIVYFSGVFCGSLSASLVQPKLKLAGASGGVYSLLTAHIATILMNYKEKLHAGAQLVFYIIIIIIDLGTTIYHRHEENVSYTAHLAGAAAGVLVGVNVLRNFEVSKFEEIIRWITRVIFVIFMAIAIIWNVGWPSYFGNSHVSNITNGTEHG